MNTCDNEISIVSREDCLLLMKLLKDSDNELREYAAAILVNLLSKQGNKIILCQEGAILACINLLSDRCNDVLQCTVSALFSALTEYANQVIFMNADGLHAFIPLLEHEESEIKISSSKILERLMQESDFQLVLVQKNYLHFVIKLLDDAEEDARKSAILILYHLATNTRTQSYLINDEVMPRIQKFSERSLDRLTRAWSQQILDICKDCWTRYLKRKRALTHLSSVQETPNFSAHGMFGRDLRNPSMANNFNRDRSIAEYYLSSKPSIQHRLFLGK